VLATHLQVREEPALVQVGEVPREPHRVRLVDCGAGFGGGRGWADRLLSRTLMRSHFCEPKKRRKLIKIK
jgi:hypothetical protein